MTQLLADILDHEVVIAADRFQLLGGGPNVIQDNNATKLVSNSRLIIALAGDWPVAAPLDRPTVWLTDWLTKNSWIRHARRAAKVLKADLEALSPTCHVKGGTILMGSCSNGRPQVVELTGASVSETDYFLDMAEPLTMNPGNPLPRGIFKSWAQLTAAVNLPMMPARTDVPGRRAFLSTVIAQCEGAGIGGIRGPALVEWRPR